MIAPRPKPIVSLIVRLLLISLLILIGVTAVPTSQAAGPPTPHSIPPGIDPSPEPVPPRVKTGSDDAHKKLSPDLRAIAKIRAKKPVLISVLMTQDTAPEMVANLMIRAAIGKPRGDLRWVTGEIDPANLLKLGSIPGVLSVISTETYQPVDTPGGEELKPQWASPSRETLRTMLHKGDKKQLLSKVEKQSFQRLPRKKPALSAASASRDLTSVKVRDIHGADEAHAEGYTGTGVVAAVVDTGVDFGHPDLQGTQARIAGGPYDGWPYAYNTLSGLFYALGPITIGPDTYWDWVTSTWYVHTLPVPSPICNTITCTATLKIDYGTDAGWPWSPVELSFTWPDTSQSGNYYYTVHPDILLLIAGLDLGLGYAATDIAPPAVIVSDETTAGVYDTVYVDVDFDQDLTDEKPMHKGDELAGADLFDASGALGADGIWDLSAGMLTWISDGTNHPPGVDALYFLDGVPIPGAGQLLSFVGDEDSHGTNVAGMIAAQGVITDPEWIGPINPLFAGAANIGGAGGPVLAGMAPAAKVAAFQNGFFLPFDSWWLSALGFDGIPNTGDEAQVVNNSWGSSATINDGWDETSRFAHWLNRNFAPYTAFLVATGNGGHGYGTASSPNGATIIDVGASTSYGSLVLFEFVDPSQFTWGDVQPWSNRGPTTLGDDAPDVMCVGAWGTGANPLNLYASLLSSFGLATGEAAYDLFGGTSMASPVCAGITALIYQAYHDTHGRWPTWEEAKDLLINGATDLGHDVLSQGAGNANADRSTDIAAGEAISVTLSSAQWQVGDYRGTRYPAFPSIVHPGDVVNATFTVHNPTGIATKVSLSDTTLERVHETTFEVSFPEGTPATFQIPTWITDITSLIDTYDADLVRAQVIFPFSTFDPGGDYTFDNRWRVLFYDWTDLDTDGQLWTDTNGNGVIDASLDGDPTNDEIDVETGPIGESEYNRFTYGYPSGTYLEASVGRNSLSRRHDGVFLGLQRRTGTAPVTLQVRLTFYKKTDWGWLTLSTNNVNVPAEGSADFNATLSVPANARLGVYQGAIEYSASPTQILPVVVHVAANSTTFDFGATSLTEPLGDQPYDNGHLLGGFDWSWRYESGDWKLFSFDIPDGTATPGKTMIVDTHWVNPTTPIPAPAPLFFEGFEAWPPAGWNIVDNIGSCTWDAGSNDLNPESNDTGGSGDYADADSDNCGTGMDTELWTPPLDLSGLTQAWLAFKSDFQDFGGQDDGYVDISTDGGTTWTNLLHYEKMDFPGPRRVYLDLTPHVGSANTLIRFRYVAPDWHWWWQVDDVAIYSEDPRLPAVTDVDTWIFGAAPDFLSTTDPTFFGPSNVEEVGGSNDTYIGSGTFLFDTATNGAREVVAGEIRDGLGFLALHNVLYAGTQFGEPLMGQTYQLDITPYPAVVTTTLLTGSWDETFTATRSIDEGVEVLAFGLSQPLVLQDELAIQDDPDDPCTASWVRDVNITNGGLLDVHTTSTAPALDIDLYVYRDDGDGVWECDGDDALIGSSTTPTADEQVRVTLPPDGKYWVTVHGWNVPAGSLFDITINAVQGTDLTLEDVPVGAIPANTPQTITIGFNITNNAVQGTGPTQGSMPGGNLPANAQQRLSTALAPSVTPPQTYQGLVFLGPAAAPTALGVPVTLNFVLGDADGDDIPDHIEGRSDPDNDGVPNYLDTDSDGDGIPDNQETAADADNDGIPNFLDLDSDGDGIPDRRETAADADNDGIPNFLDLDSDGDGIPDQVEGVADADFDLIPNFLDRDSDNDGIPDIRECPAGPPCPDSDGDNIPDYLDAPRRIRAVGGYGEPLGTLELLAPWLQLITLIVAGGIAVVLRRRLG